MSILLSFCKWSFFTDILKHQESEFIFLVFGVFQQDLDAGLRANSSCVMDWATLEFILVEDVGSEVDEELNHVVLILVTN